VVTNTLQSFVGDVAGSTGFAFDTVASGGAMTSGTTDRMLAVFQNNGTNKVSISAGGNVYAANSFIANSTDYGIGDVAEYVNLANGASAEAGDVLVIDTTGSNVYKKSDSAYAKNVAGVVSDTGKFVMGASGLNRAPLALAGLVKVKVTNENGAINPGDYLITASKPGYAMKYDPANSLSAAGLVGMALESLIDTEGKITILVNKGLVAGASNNVTMSVDGSGQLISNNNLDLAGGGITNVGSIAAASGLWQIDSEGKLIAKSITADKIQTKELVLAKDQTQESTIGEATILSGQQNVEVLNTKIKKNSKIFVTFRGNPGSFWWIGNQEDGKFSVFLSSNAAQDITFDYWLVTIDEEDTTASVGTEVIPGANNTNPFTNLPPIGSTSGSDSSNDGGTTENSESNSTETAGNSTSGEADTTTNTNAATDESSSAATNNENSSSSSGNTEASTDNSTNSETADTLPSSETTTETAS
ncbi:MAG TPA: hypothetical protein PLD97_02175, partial [bacterium]|nr:hypothetical protein [bacterium]